MTSINASTTIKIVSKKKPTSSSTGIGISPVPSSNSLTGMVRGTGASSSVRAKAKAKPTKSSSAADASKPRGAAPKLAPKSLATPEQLEHLKSLSPADQQEQITNLLRAAFGEKTFAQRTPVPHTASQTRDRAFAAADLAVAANALGVRTVLKTCGVLVEIEKILMPNGIGAVFASSEKTTSGMLRIASTASLASLASVKSDVSDDNRTDVTGMSYEKGKITPVNSREGALLILRALAEIGGRQAEPYVVPMLAAAMDESASSQGSIRDASEDTSRAIVQLANPHAAHVLICPVLFEALKSPEWRVKLNALGRFTQLASTAPYQTSRLLPKIIPVISQQVWDTKPQVSKAAGACLLATCNTNINPDVKPAIPAVVQAIVRPADTVKAIEELMGTTFVATVDASTLSLLCPVLSRGLKEKLAVHKRACCLVISNMSRLVETPDAVAPFGPLLVPELKKVADTVQFEEIRDEALGALKTLTKALGHSSIEEAVTAMMKEEEAAVEEEQNRIKREREEEAARERALAAKEEEEKRLWREAQEATRLLEKLKMQGEEEKKAEENKHVEAAKRSTKAAGGQCKACGLKKCRKDCLFIT